MIDAGMLEKAADDRAHPDAVRDPGTPGRRQHTPRTIRSISHAGARGAVQRLDDGRLGERVQLGDDARRLAGARMLGLALDLRA